MNPSQFIERIRSSMRFRLSLLITVLTTFLTITFTSYYIKHERHTYISRLQMKGTLLADLLAGSIQTALYADNNEEVALHVAGLFSQGEIYSIKIINTRGAPVAYAVNDGMRSDINDLTITRKIVSTSGQYSPETLLLGEEPTSQFSGIIELKMDSSQLKIITRNLLTASYLLAFLFWIATTGVTFILLRRVTATFQLLMQGVKNIEEGDLSVRFPAEEHDEPGRALSALNNLTAALERKNAENQLLQAKVVKGLRLQIDEEKNKHMAKLIQTNRMTSLGLLVSSMAHEINNPNGAIRLASEILERAWKDVLPVLDEVSASEGEIKICGLPYTDAMEDIEKAVEAITRSSIRIERVVQNLRTYSLGDRENQQIAFDLNRVAENSVAIIRAHGNMANIIINTVLSPVIPAVSGNPFQLEQVVINLLMNSIQSLTKNNSRIITVSTLSTSAGDEVELIVQDSGPGISTENLPYIFEPFFSTRIEQGGSGLGLYIASFIVKEQKGTLELINIEGGGCRAVIRLPAVKAVNPPPFP